MSDTDWKYMYETTMRRLKGLHEREFLDDRSPTNAKGQDNPSVCLECGVHWPCMTIITLSTPITKD